jgi:hypothetical protein
MWRTSWVINQAKGLIAVRIFATLKQIFCKEDAEWQSEQGEKQATNLQKILWQEFYYCSNTKKNIVNKIQDKMKNNYEFLRNKLLFLQEYFVCSIYSI